MNNTKATKYKGVYVEGDHYRGRITYCGKAISVRGKTQKECYMKILEKKTEIDHSIDNLDVSKEKITLCDLYEEYKLKKMVNFTQQTICHKNSLFKNHFKPLADICVNELTDNILNNWIVNIEKINEKKNAKDCSNVPMKVSKLMHNLLEYAVRKKYLNHYLDEYYLNIPTKNIRITDRTQNNYITYKELLKIVEEAEKVHYKFKNGMSVQDTLFALKFLYYTGLRINEARAIQKKDVIKVYNRMSLNPEKNVTHVVKVYKQFVGDTDIVEQRLKCNAPARNVLILKEQYDDFISFFESKRYNDESYVFDFFHEKKPATRKSITYKIKTLIVKLKKDKLLPEYINELISPHGLRRSNTLYHKNILKLRPSEASEIEGHTPSVLVDIYDRADKEVLNDIFGSKE